MIGGARMEQPDVRVEAPRHESSDDRTRPGVETVSDPVRFVDRIAPTHVWHVDLSSALGGTRTPNLLIRSQMLYPLGYERRIWVMTSCCMLS